MAGEATGVLAEFAASLRYEDLPESVREHCKHLLLDALACALPATRARKPIRWRRWRKRSRNRAKRA